MNSHMPPIRMVFEMSREEHPRLYDDLIRFPKGTKRINRLRTLAHDGLLLQLGVVARTRFGSDVDRLAEDGRKAVVAAAGLTNQIFDEPLSE